MPTRFDYLRLSAAYCAAGIAAWICSMRGHLQINVARPATYLKPFGYKSGLLLLACIAWLVVEMVRLATSGAAFGPDRAKRN